MTKRQSLIELNAAVPDPSLTAATLVWADALGLEAAAALTGQTPEGIVTLIENRLPDVRIEHTRLVSSGQLQELVGRQQLAEILTLLKEKTSDMTPGQLLATGTFMHQVSGLQHDRQLVAKGENPEFSVRIVVDGSPTPAGFRGISIDLSAVGQNSQKT